MKYPSIMNETCNVKENFTLFEKYFTIDGVNKKFKMVAKEEPIKMLVNEDVESAITKALDLMVFDKEGNTYLANTVEDAKKIQKEIDIEALGFKFATA